MTSAATRILLLASLVFGGLSGSAVAGVQLDPADTLGSAVSTAASPTGQASDLTNSASDLTNSAGDAADGVTGSVNDAVEDVAGTVNDATGSVTGGTASGGGAGGGGGGGSGSSPLDSVTGSITGALSGSSDSVAGGTSSGGGSGSSPTSGRSSSSSGDGSGSNRGSHRTRFDRLPRQYERLLERIESGVDVRASSARLRALLATASPSLRKQISRLIRQEIRRLRKGGLTHQERAALRRLTPLLRALEASRPPAAISPVASGPASLPATSSERHAQIAGISDASLLTERPAGSGPSGSEPTPVFPLPFPSPPGLVYWLPVLLAAIAGCLWLAARAPRNGLPSAVRGFVEVRGAELSGLAALIAIVGAAWAILIQLLFL